MILTLTDPNRNDLRRETMAGNPYPTTQLPNEGAKPYQAFRTYLDLGEKRTYKLVSKKLKKSEGIVGRWAMQFNWKERLTTFHAEEAERANKAAEQAALEVAREREARRNVVQDGAWQLYEALKAKALAMLNFPVARQTVESKDGKTVTIVEPIRWRFSDVARVAEVADGLARLSTGMATTNAQLRHTGPDGGPLPAPVAGEISVHIHTGSVKQPDMEELPAYKVHELPVAVGQ